MFFAVERRHEDALRRRLLDRHPGVRASARALYTGNDVTARLFSDDVTARLFPRGGDIRRFTIVCVFVAVRRLRIPRTPRNKKKAAVHPPA